MTTDQPWNTIAILLFCRSRKIKPWNVFTWEEIGKDVVIEEEQIVNDDEMLINDIIEDQIIMINQMKKILPRKILLKNHMVF